MALVPNYVYTQAYYSQVQPTPCSMSRAFYACRSCHLFQHAASFHSLGCAFRCHPAKLFRYLHARASCISEQFCVCHRRYYLERLRLRGLRRRSLMLQSCTAGKRRSRQRGPNHSILCPRSATRTMYRGASAANERCSGRTRGSCGMWGDMLESRMNRHGHEIASCARALLCSLKTHRPLNRLACQVLPSPGADITISFILVLWARATHGPIRQVVAQGAP